MSELNNISYLKSLDGEQARIAGDLDSVKLELQFAVKIEHQSVLVWFTHTVLPFDIVKTGLRGLHKLYTIKFLFFCH